MKEGYIYILYNEEINKYYLGSTNNLKRRLYEHLAGKNRYTRSAKYWQLVFYQRFNSTKEARRIEYKLKRFKSRIIIEKNIKEVQ